MTTAPKINITFDPINRAQELFMDCSAAGALASGAFGTGKTVSVCAKGLRYSLDYPGNFGLIARKTRSSMTHTTLKTFFDLVCPKELIENFNKTEGLLTLTNGSGIVFGGLDDPLKLGSLNLGWAGIDEALETDEEDFLMLEGRLRLPNVPHQIFAATNPGPPSHYLYEKFLSGNPNYQVFQSATADNPTLPADYLERLETFTGVYYDRNVLGLWRGLEGLVYSSFHEDICLIPRFEIPSHWLIYTGHDFGGANPAAMFYAQDPATGFFYAWQEYKPGGGYSTHDHVLKFKEITEGRTVIRRNGGSHQEDEIRQGYTAQGWPITEPKLANDVQAGIQAVFDQHSFNKIYVFSDLKEYLREKLSYAYKKGGLDPNEIENKKKYHLMDAERSILSDFPPEGVKSGQVTEIHKFT